ncbi:MAG: glycogen/starch synthase, partial [Bacteroidia bacterium]
NPTFVNVSKAAIDLADGIIIGSAKINSDVNKYIKKSGKPVLDFVPGDNNEYIDAYSEFYDAVLEEVAVLAD